ncbi:MAG TPA: RidA family protein [Bacteroidia bacterium]|jgi:2-iminobutanoate/2-iminopropanoate deaminase|nr:RidA family protein [Bacteroidia bacterium]
MKTIFSKNAPEPIGPYSHAVQAGNLVFVSGQVGKDSNGGMHTENIKEETTQVMTNVKNILEAAGLTMANVVKTTIFLINMDDFAQVNEIYGSFFTGNYPARETVQVSRLPLNVNIEISVIASAE